MDTRNNARPENQTFQSNSRSEDRSVVMGSLSVSQDVNTDPDHTINCNKFLCSIFLFQKVTLRVKITSHTL